MPGTNNPAMGYPMPVRIGNCTADYPVPAGSSFIAVMPRSNTVGWGWVQADDNGSERGKAHRYNPDRPYHTA